MMAEVQQHIQIGAIGVGPLRPTIYSLEKKEGRHLLSSLALWALAEDGARPDEIWLLRTPETEKHWESIEAEAEKIGATVVPVDIAGNEQPDDVDGFLHNLANLIPTGSRLTLDVTQGLRHHAFLFYALALYLSTFRDVIIEGAWYCRWEISRDDTVARPFIDLKPVLELAHWFHALAMFRDHGSAMPMARLLEPHIATLRTRAQHRNNDRELHQSASALDQVVKLFGSYSFAYESALPLEIGKAGRLLSDRIKTFPETDPQRRLPLFEDLCAIINQTADSAAFDHQPPRKGEWKTTIELSAEELERQARLIETYLDRNQIAVGVGLMREWVITWTMLRSGHTGPWIDYPNRKPYEQRLGMLGALCSHDHDFVVLSSEQQAFGDFWNQLSDQLRNALLHHGMRRQAMEDPPEQLLSVRCFWHRLRTGDVAPPDLGGGHERLLICPIGMSPGVLYSAVQQVTPARVLVVCSEESSPAIEEALQRCDSSPESLRLIMDNPFAGADEFESLLDQTLPWLYEADEIHANLTGGTALISALIGRLARESQRRFQRPVREFVLIDKRSPEEQRADPWQLGSIHYLDEHENDRTKDDDR